MEISNNTNSILNSNLNTNSSVSEEQKDRFDIFLENQEKDKAEKKERSQLLGDLEFVSKTGFTKEELARIKELLEELQKQRAESGQAPLSPEEYIQALKQDLQTAIYEVTGKKVDLDNETIEEDADTLVIKGNKKTNKVNVPSAFVQELDLKDQRVFINLESKALGDNIAWMPYVEQFRQKWGCHIIVTTFWNKLFQNEYPEIEFVRPGTTADNLYAQYRVGCYDNDYTRNKNNWRETPLQKIAADVLGLNFKEIKPKISVNPIPRTGRRYICISDHSTMQAKFWNYPGGWQEIVNYLGDLAYDVVAVSKDPTGLTKLVPVNNIPIENIASIINNCEFFFGVGSGLSWLAWALNKKVIMISGFSDPFTEFQSNNYRIAPPLGACHGCFNDKSLTFDRSWNWCPRNKDFECTKLITPEMVKEKIDLLISHL